MLRKHTKYGMCALTVELVELEMSSVVESVVESVLVSVVAMAYLGFVLMIVCHLQ